MSKRSGIQLGGLDADNFSYHGILQFHQPSNQTTNQNTQYHFRFIHNSSTNMTALDVYDHDGAMWYVIVVVLVYGLSILMLIGSQIKKRPDKIIEDKEVNFSQSKGVNNVESGNI